MNRIIAAVFLFALGCKSAPPSGIEVMGAEAQRAYLEPYVAALDDSHVSFAIGSVDAVKSRGEKARIAVVEDLDCGECFEVEAQGDFRFVAHGGNKLGAQYALSQLLENLGYGFFHPRHIKTASFPLDVSLAAVASARVVPEQTRRGLHLHTLHPTEQMYDFWLPGDDHLVGAKRVIDWVVKNRGNHLQWVGLDDIQKDPATLAAWRLHTQAIVAEAHARGLTTGLAIQLFGKSNLQNAFDLLDDPIPVDTRAEIRRRLVPVLDALPFDLLDISFGEFFEADSEAFVQTLNQFVEVANELSPGISLGATIHVGNYPNLRVTYRGETLLYYFLVKFADARLVPWIHSVMYFNLFEDAGGAYLHQQFDEHRDYLLTRLKNGQSMVYFPESAYWVAFDINVPTYLPLYVRSRWLDLQKIRDAGTPLTEHVLFSSGWEWGYWLNDASTLRMGVTLPASWGELLQQQLKAYGPAGVKVADALTALGDAQHDGLIIQRLAAYLAGRDQLIDAGELRGIVSQPDRLEFSEFAAKNKADRDAFITPHLANLRALEAAHATALAALESSGADLNDRFIAEMRDGVEVTQHRLQFVIALWAATAAFADGQSATASLADADAAFAAGMAVVNRRRPLMHDPEPRRIIGDDLKNPTFYQYGYLREAQSLCFWNRERAQAHNLIEQAGVQVPGCVL